MSSFVKKTNSKRSTRAAAAAPRKSKKSMVRHYDWIAAIEPPKHAISVSPGNYVIREPGGDVGNYQREGRVAHIPDYGRAKVVQQYEFLVFKGDVTWISGRTSNFDAVDHPVYASKRMAVVRTAGDGGIAGKFIVDEGLAKFPIAGKEKTHTDYEFLDIPFSRPAAGRNIPIWVGSVTKSGAHYRSWKQRHLVITSDSVSYYACSTASSPKGQIPIGSINSFWITHCAKKMIVYLFTHDRAWGFIVDSEDMARKLVQSIGEEQSPEEGRLLREGALSVAGTCGNARHAIVLSSGMFITLRSNNRKDVIEVHNLRLCAAAPVFSRTGGKYWFEVTVSSGSCIRCTLTPGSLLGPDHDLSDWKSVVEAACSDENSEGHAAARERTQRAAKHKQRSNLKKGSSRQRVRPRARPRKSSKETAAARRDQGGDGEGERKRASSDASQASSSRAEEGETENLPSGWASAECTDAQTGHSRKYYFRQDTTEGKSTTWERPTEPASRASAGRRLFRSSFDADAAEIDVPAAVADVDVHDLVVQWSSEKDLREMLADVHTICPMLDSALLPEDIHPDPEVELKRIEKAYRKAIRRLHPDRMQSQSEWTELEMRLGTALFMVLKETHSA